LEKDMRVPTVFAAAGLILVAASATACSGGSETAATAPAASTGASGAPAAADAGTGPGSSSAKNFDVCTALTATAASKITGTKFTKAKTSTVSQISNCEYDGPAGALLQISVQFSGGKIGLDAIVSTLKAVGHPPKPVSGVGDQAFSEPNPQGNEAATGASSAASYGALYGTTFIQIGGLTYVTAAQGKQIVEELHSKL
jgi:hypothetical protein